MMGEKEEKCILTKGPVLQQAPHDQIAPTQSNKKMLWLFFVVCLSQTSSSVFPPSQKTARPQDVEKR
jgi:hypothetical protein